MRNITERIVNAWQRGEPLQTGNSMTDGKSIFLHANEIVRRDDDGRLFVRTAGWNTVTTRERLNAIPGVSVCVMQKQIYLNGHPWEDHEDWTEIFKDGRPWHDPGMELPEMPEGLSAARTEDGAPALETR